MKIPYGISDFDLLRREGYFYVDKTMFLPRLEGNDTKGSPGEAGRREEDRPSPQQGTAMTRQHHTSCAVARHFGQEAVRPPEGENVYPQW